MKTLLFIFLSFIAITAGISGIMMIANPGGGIFQMPLSLLEGTPFKNFLGPGIILAAFVGGVNLLAVIQHLKRSPGRYNWAMAGGSILCSWIVGQMILIQAVSWLQFVYLAIGLLTILIAYQLKGKWAV